MRRLKKGLQRFRIATALALVLLGGPLVYAIAAVEAPTGFDNLTNGLVSQAQFDLDREIFEERELIEDGLGPVYNAQACAECHQNPVTGSSSQISEFRVGRFNGVSFSNPPGGSLINDRAIDARIQERITSTDNVRTLRMSLNTLGDGFVEAISNTTLQNIQASQPSSLRGTIINVPVLEAGNALRIGRFGWKNQHASLVSFSADAYLNEMGITSPFAPNENTSYGASVAAFDDVPDPEEAPTPEFPAGPDIEFFARFMRATKAPPRDTAVINHPDVLAGQSLFTQIGCSHCHVASITTAPAGTVINGGAFVVPPALGDKIIHPYSDFLLHDVGTGDGIVQNGGAATRNMVRTPPLWGLRSRVRLMHDGATTLRHEAILRHAGQATSVINSYRSLSVTQQNQIGAFLNSL
jgi:CxxC motif-containing protein (DUF1111 family)